MTAISVVKQYITVLLIVNRITYFVFNTTTELYSFNLRPCFFFKYRCFRLIFFFFILLLLYCFWLPKIGLHVLLKMVVLGKQVICRQAEWFRVHIQLLLVFCFNSYLS